MTCLCVNFSRVWRVACPSRRGRRPDYQTSAGWSAWHVPRSHRSSSITEHLVRPRRQCCCCGISAGQSVELPHRHHTMMMISYRPKSIARQLIPFCGALSQQRLLDPIKPAYDWCRPDGQLSYQQPAPLTDYISMTAVLGPNLQENLRINPKFSISFFQVYLQFILSYKVKIFIDFCI